MKGVTKLYVHKVQAVRQKLIHHISRRLGLKSNVAGMVLWNPELQMHCFTQTIGFRKALVQKTLNTMPPVLDNMMDHDKSLHRDKGFDKGLHSIRPQQLFPNQKQIEMVYHTDGLQGVLLNLICFSEEGWQFLANSMLKRADLTSSWNTLHFHLLMVSDVVQTVQL